MKFKSTLFESKKTAKSICIVIISNIDSHELGKSLNISSRFQTDFILLNKILKCRYLENSFSQV